MSRIDRFAAYAGAFEKAFADDDWSVVEPFFTEDAVYEVDLDPPMGGRFEGRDAILAYFKEILDRFDRRFESREIQLHEGPREDGDSVWIRGSAIYRAAGVPEVVLTLEETLHFDGDRICRMEDVYEDSVKEQANAFLRDHAAKLGIPTE